jgi:hypothetical protein
MPYHVCVCDQSKYVFRSRHSSLSYVRLRKWRDIILVSCCVRSRSDQILCPFTPHFWEGGVPRSFLCPDRLFSESRSPPSLPHHTDMSLKSLSKEDIARLELIFDNPKSRQDFLEQIQKSSKKSMAPDQKATTDALIKILQNPKITSKNLTSTISKLAAAEAKGQVVDAMKGEVVDAVVEEVACELLILLVDVNTMGLLSAVRAVYALTKNDFSGLKALVGPELVDFFKENPGLLLACTVM